jgi:hypothetical protein
MAAAATERVVIDQEPTLRSEGEGRWDPTLSVVKLRRGGPREVLTTPASALARDPGVYPDRGHGGGFQRASGGRPRRPESGAKSPETKKP